MKGGRSRGRGGLFTVGGFKMGFQGNHEEEEEEQQLGERSPSQKLGEIIDTEMASSREGFSPAAKRTILRMLEKVVHSKGCRASSGHVTKNNCRTVCTAKCAKEHNKEGGKKYPICDLPYSVTSYLSPEETRRANSHYYARRRQGRFTVKKLEVRYRCASYSRAVKGEYKCTRPAPPS